MFASQNIFAPLLSSSNIVFDLFESECVFTHPGSKTIGVPILTVTGTSMFPSHDQTGPAIPLF